MIYDFGFDALCELCELCVVEVPRRWHSSCFLFFAGAFDLNRIVMHLDMKYVSLQAPEKVEKKEPAKEVEKPKADGVKACL